MKMPADVLLGLWKTKQTIIEERNKEHEKSQSDSSGNISSLSSANSMLSSVKNSMPSSFGSGGFSMPSINSF